MATRTAHVEWNGDFRTGNGEIKSGSGAFKAGYSFASIFGDGPGTNPVEMLGASLAGCFSGGLAAMLSKDGSSLKRICTDVEVFTKPAGKGFVVDRIHLRTQVEAIGIEKAELLQHAELVKRTCPVAVALGGTEITLEVELV